MSFITFTNSYEVSDLSISNPALQPDKLAGGCVWQSAIEAGNSHRDCFNACGVYTFDIHKWQSTLSITQVEVVSILSLTQDMWNQMDDLQRLAEVKNAGYAKAQLLVTGDNPQASYEALFAEFKAAYGVFPWETVIIPTPNPTPSNG